MHAWKVYQKYNINHRKDKTIFFKKYYSIGNDVCRFWKDYHRLEWISSSRSQQQTLTKAYIVLSGHGHSYYSSNSFFV